MKALGCSICCKDPTSNSMGRMNKCGSGNVALGDVTPLRGCIESGEFMPGTGTYGGIISATESILGGSLCADDRMLVRTPPGLSQRWET